MKNFFNFLGLLFMTLLLSSCGIQKSDVNVQDNQIVNNEVLPTEQANEIDQIVSGGDSLRCAELSNSEEQEFCRDQFPVSKEEDTANEPQDTYIDWKIPEASETPEMTEE